MGKWDTALIWSDTRHEYGELRMSSLVLLGTRLYFVVFVDRADQRRIISVRKANNREQKRYVREISNDQ
ncbi:BrnT family toxin [Chromatium okenii]|uniref:BrnT family toxin n=1 Tax=Chromatium okenii TaxID=61644 RepID=UPI00308403B3